MLLRNTRPPEDEVQEYILAHFGETKGNRNDEQIRMDDNLRRDSVDAKLKAHSILTRVEKNRANNVPPVNNDSGPGEAEILIAKNRECFSHTILKFSIPGKGSQYFLFLYAKKAPKFQVNLLRIVPHAFSQEELQFLKKEQLSNQDMMDNMETLEKLTDEETYFLRPPQLFYGDMNPKIPKNLNPKNIMVMSDITVGPGLKVTVAPGTKFNSLTMFLERWVAKFGEPQDSNDPEEGSSAKLKSSNSSVSGKAMTDDDIELDEQWIGKDIFALELAISEALDSTTESAGKKKSEGQRLRGKRTDEQQEEWWRKLREMKETDALARAEVEEEEEELSYFSGPDLSTESLQVAPTYYSSRLLINEQTKRITSWATLYKIPHSCAGFFSKFSRSVCYLLCVEYKKKVLFLYRMWSGSADYCYPSKIEYSLTESLVHESTKEGVLVQVKQRMAWGPSNPKSQERLRLVEG